MISSLWEIHLTKFAFVLSHLLKTQNRKILPWTRNSKQKLIFGNNGSRCFQHKIYSARSWQLPTGINIPLGCCLAPCQLSGSSCKELPGFCVPEQPHHVQCFGQVSRSPNESLTGLLTEEAISPGSHATDKLENTRNVALGRWHCGIILQEKQGTSSKHAWGLPVPRCAGGDKDISELHPRQGRTGLWGLADSMFNHPNATFSSLEAPGACFAGHSATHTWQQDDSACMLGHKGPAFPKGIAFPPA